MNLTRSARRNIAVPVLVGLLLSGCAGDDPEALLASAKEYLAKRDNKAAVIQIKNALQQNPDLAEARFLLGRALLETGDPVGAEIELRKAVTLKYSGEQTMPLIARSLLAQGKARKLLDDFAKLPVSSPEAVAEVQTSLATAHASLGKQAEAEAAIEAAIAARPGHAPARLVKARMMAVRGDLAGAMGVVDQVIASMPGDADAHKLRGDLSLARRDVDQAIASYRKALEARPEFLLAHAALIAVLLTEGKQDVAATQIEALQKAVPKHPLATHFESRLAFLRKDLPKARELSLQFLKALPDNPMGLALAGAVEYHLGSYVQAELHFGKLVRLAPDSIDARQQLALTHLRLGQPARAMYVLEPILDRIEGNSNLLALVGQVAMQNGDPVAAERYFAKASALDSKSIPKRTALALANLVKGNESALLELEQIAAQDSGIQADMALIATALRKGQADRALKFLDALQKKMKDSPVPHQLRGAAFLAKKDRVSARQSFEQALKVSPGYFPAASALATLDSAEGKPGDAAQRFDSVLAADPKNVDAYLALAGLKARSGAKPDEIVSLLSRAVTANPSLVAPRVALIQFQAQAKDLKKALASAQDAVAAVPDRPELLEVLGRVQLAAGDANQALASFGKMAGLQPHSPAPHMRSAEVHLASKNRDAAMQSLRKAIELKPDHLEAQGALVALNIEAGDSAKALAIAREVQTQRPKESAGYIMEGDVHAAKREWKQAATAYRSGLKVARNDALAIRLHEVLSSGGQAAEAKSFAAGWTKDHPRDVAFRLHLGDRAIAENRYDEALAHYRAVVGLQPGNALALNNLAWVSGRQRDPKALEYAERANRIVPDNPAFMDTLAMILLDRGEGARAVQVLRSASEKAPNAFPIRLNLVRALARTGDKAAANKELEALEKLGEKGPRKEVLDAVRKEI